MIIVGDDNGNSYRDGVGRIDDICGLVTIVVLVIVVVVVLIVLVMVKVKRVRANNNRNDGEGGVCGKEVA